MKNSMKCVVLSFFISVITAVSINAGNQVTILNKSGNDVYVALVTTQKFSGNEKLTKTKGKEYAKILGTLQFPKPLNTDRYIKFENFPRSLMYDRTLFVAETPKALKTALGSEGGMTMNINGDKFEVGSANKVTIKGNGKFDTAASVTGMPNHEKKLSSLKGWLK